MYSRSFISSDPCLTLFQKSHHFVSDIVLETLCALFDLMSAAVIIISRNGRIHFANKAARDMLEEGSSIRRVDGCLICKNSSAGVALKQALEQTSAPAQEGLPHWQTQVCLVPASLDHPVAIAHIRELSCDTDEPLFALCISRTGQKNHHGFDGFSDAYNLSKAEARTLKKLVDSEAPPDSESHAVALSTVKSHLRNIFKKTRTSRQPDLFRLVDLCRTPLRKTDKT